MPWLLSALLGAPACTAPPDPGPSLADSGQVVVDTEPRRPCEPQGPPVVELALAGGSFGSLTDGAPILFGDPPQGGAPYAPFQIRVRNLLQEAAGFRVAMTARDLDEDVEIGSAQYTQRLVCANVGDNADHFVGPELHLRFWDLALDELEARRVELVLDVDNFEGGVATATLQGVLEPMDD